MVGRFDQKQDDPESSPENSSDSPLSGTDHDIKITNNVSFPKQRKSAKKRVVSVTINDGGEKAADVSIPPSDSWAWRKYGQKPIKGSPYPRGYYKCSSSKGCPARKQVEKSRADPNVLQVTYFYEHNHSRPAARNPMTATPEAVVDSNKSKRQRAESEEIDLCHESQNNEPGWFLNLELATSYATIYESPVMSETKVTDVNDVEDESLFADLGELPEFSRGFRRGWDEE